MMRHCLGLLALLALPAAQAASAPGPTDFAADFTSFWQTVREEYAYLDAKQTDWDCVRRHYAPLAAKAQDKRAFIGVMESVIDELHDGHLHLRANTANSPRLLPSGMDIWAAWQGETARIGAVKPGTPAAAAGLRPGMSVLELNGQPIAQAAARRLGRCLKSPAPEARDHALRAALAGNRAQERQLVVEDAGKTRRITLPADEPQAFRVPAGLLEQRRLPGGYGYIRIHNSLGDTALVGAFDQALNALRDSPGLILDLRDTPSGGNTVVGRGLMGRFIAVEAPYQVHELVGEARATGIRRRWIELVAPRGPFPYQKPLVVLADHWTGSMGEGIAIGLHGLKRATVIGTPMAGLLGAVYSYELERSGIGYNLPAEKLFHVNGTPREAFRPDRLIDESQARTGQDPVLEAGLETLETLSRENPTP